jgi:hypothetical protein
MTKGQGICRIDAVKVVEITLATRAQVPGAGVEAKFVLMNSNTGERFGSGTFSTWSDETATKFNELIRSMENDICTAVFVDGPTTDSVPEDGMPLEDEIPGL